MKMVYSLYIVFGVIALFLTSCLDEDKWLDIKSRKSDVVPSTLEDFQAILDNDMYMNRLHPGLGQVSADNSYVTEDVFNAAFWETERNAYIWAPKIFVDDVYEDWSAPYMIVAYANIALEGLQNIGINDNNHQALTNVRGSALFYRADAFYNLIQKFAKPYDPATAATDPGIPLRLSSDVNEQYARASVQQTYDQIIKDLQEAAALLPVTPEYQTRPSRPAANGLLARLYLNIGKYAMALDHADKALEDFSTLIDFNAIDASSAKPFPAYPDNEEVVFYAELPLWTFVYSPYSIVDSTLYDLYAEEDLRRTVFYTDEGDKVIRFKGQYTGTNNNFGGIATNELYLIKAEAHARMDQMDEAMTTLNDLLVKRWKSGAFIPFNVSGIDEALELIIGERRKELPFTANLRWEDLRRLNADPRFAKTLIRKIGGQTYTLPPNDPRYVFDIPDQEIELSGIEQNER